MLEEERRCGRTYSAVLAVVDCTVWLTLEHSIDQARVILESCFVSDEVEISDGRRNSGNIPLH